MNAKIIGRDYQITGDINSIKFYNLVSCECEYQMSFLLLKMLHYYF